MASSSAPIDEMKIGFAKLQGDDFVYYMQSYSFIIGHDTEHSRVDLDLGKGIPGMEIAPHHARIFFDFKRMQFALEVYGTTGCYVNNHLHIPGSPLQLKGKDLLQIGNKKFYFLLPVQSIFKTMEERTVQLG